MRRFSQRSFIQRAFLREFSKAAAFLLLLALVFSAFCRLFSFKYDGGIYNFKTFYEQEESSVDVLVIGSSHAYEHIHTGTLYDEYGAAAFNLSSSMQPLWSSYHFLVEALKTQTPKLVVLEGYMLASDEEYTGDRWNVYATYGFKPSLNWIRHLLACAPKEDFFSHFFRFYRYHNRYDADLGPEDFYAGKGLVLHDDWKGYLPIYLHARYDMPHALGSTDIQPLLPRIETYYREFIELCQSRGIPLHIVVSPYYFSEQDIARFNRAQEIAGEYGVPFTNYNTPEGLAALNFDYGRDMSASNHLYYSASVSFTRHLGEMLVSAYDLPDRRGDERYASWARSAAYHRRDFDNQQFLREETQLAPYLARLASDPDYTAIISVTGYLADYFDQITSWLAPFGVNDIYFPHDMNGTWASRGGEVLVRWTSDNRYPYIELDNQTVTLAKDHALIGKKPIQLVKKGLHIIVYDHVTQTIADTAAFDALSGFTAVR